jgi:hypothetical protein
MAGSNDEPTRREIFSWIEQNEKTFYRPRGPVDPIGVYFSPATRNYFAKEFLQSYEGVLILLLQKHLEFQIVTPRTLADFHGRTLVLPDVQVLDDDERKQVGRFAANGRLVVTGHDATQMPDSTGIVRFSDCPGKAYLAALQQDFAAASPDTQSKFLQSLQPGGAVEVSASPALATDIARVDGNLHVFFANFKGLQGGVNPVQTPETGATVTVKGKGDGYFLPFLGRAQKLSGQSDGNRTTFKLPPIQKGGVFWMASAQ